MSMNLTRRQQRLAQDLVAALNGETLEETFFAVWGTGLSPTQKPILIWGDDQWRVDQFGFGDYNALAEDGFLRMVIDGGHPFPKGVQGYAPTHRHFCCTMTQKLFDTVASDFGSSAKEQKPQPASKPTLDVFISHSSKDVDIAAAVIELIRAAVDISHHRIRCTSLDGYRLPGGVTTDDQLQREVREAVCFIALLTPNSLHSAYVFFELGARWGAILPFVPLLAGGSTATDLQGPLTSLNALDCSSASQLHQLVSEIAGKLGRQANSPAAYEKHLQGVITSSAKKKGSSTGSNLNL